MIKDFLIIILIILAALVTAGLIGPKWIKQPIRKYTLWADSMSIIPDSLAPKNPYTPISKWTKKQIYFFLISIAIALIASYIAWLVKA